MTMFWLGRYQFVWWGFMDKYGFPMWRCRSCRAPMNSTVTMCGNGRWGRSKSGEGEHE